MSIFENLLKPINSYINIKKEIVNTEKSIHNTKNKINNILASCLDRFLQVNNKLELLKEDKKNINNSNSNLLLREQMKPELLILDELDDITNEIISIGKNNLKLKDESQIYSKDCIQDLLDTTKVVNKFSTLKTQIKQVRFEIMENVE